MKKLILNNLNFKFNSQDQPFFHDVHIEFNSGSVYFIQGKNGVGKSTFFSILQGTTPRSALLTGTIIFNDIEFFIKNNYMNPKISAHVKTVAQDVTTMIVNPMTVEENLKLANLPTYPRCKPLSSTINTKTIMHEAHINQLMSVQQLSGGQKQILAITMALQKPTQILLLDEPTAALDEKNTHMVIQFLNTLAQTMDIIIIVITHDKELTQTYAHNRSIIIKKDINETRTVAFNT